MLAEFKLSLEFIERASGQEDFALVHEVINQVYLGLRVAQDRTVSSMLVQFSPKIVLLFLVMINLQDHKLFNFENQGHEGIEAAFRRFVTGRYQVSEKLNFITDSVKRRGTEEHAREGKWEDFHLVLKESRLSYG